MNKIQLPVHVARHAADRLAAELSPQLPIAVGQALADADPGGDEGYEIPLVRDAGSLVAGCAVLGCQSLASNAFGAGPPETLPDNELRQVLAHQLRSSFARPAAVSAEQFDRVVAVVADELVAAARRPVGRRETTPAAP